MKTKSALSWFGSDSEVAAELGAMLDHCKHVTIPFVGGASIIPFLKARAIVANDLHDLAINFYRYAAGVHGKDAQDALFHHCHYTLSHPRELQCAEFLLDQDDLKGSLTQAWAFWAQCWIGRKGKGGTKSMGGMPSVRRTANGGTNATRIRAAADDLPEWAKHFERCEWESIDFRELIPKVVDDPTCGVYCDAPWVDAGKLYLHTFTLDDHAVLAELLERFEHTTVVVRYGDHPFIRELYRGWNIIEASSRDQCNAVKGELWITNQKS